MIITLWWKTGSWKWTLAKKLKEYLWYEIIGIGDIKRNLAKEMWLTIFEWDQIWWNNPEKAQEFDLKFEDYQKSLSIDENIILDGRMAFWCQPNAFKVFLDVSDEEWAKRVFDAQRDTDARNSFEEVFDVNINRNRKGRDTYLKLYNVDIYDMSQYDLVVDTTNMIPDQILNLVLNWFEIFTNK